MASQSVNTGHCFSTLFFSDWLHLLPHYPGSHEEVGAPQAQVAHLGQPWVLSGLLAVESRVSGHGEGNSRRCACALVLLLPSAWAVVHWGGSFRDNAVPRALAAPVASP